MIVWGTSQSIQAALMFSINVHSLCALPAIQITEKKWGVVGIRYRKVDCGHQPNKWAYNSSPTKGDFPPLEKAKTRKDDLDW
jgi:hypothetical protein